MAWVYNYYDPTMTPISQGDIGDDVGLYFCIRDPNMDTILVRVIQYFPPNAPEPYFDPAEANLTEQLSEYYCYFWEYFRILGPSGSWLVRIEVLDSKSNWSPPLDLPFTVN